MRLVTGTDQTTLADIAKITQRAITSIEKGKYGLRGNRPELFSNFFGCRKEWFSHGEPPIFEQWGYWQFPSKSIMHKEKSIRVRQTRKQKKFIRAEFGEFFDENKATGYAVASVKNRENTLFFLELAGDSFLLINTDIVMLDAVKEALQKISFKKSFVVDADVLNLIGSPHDDIANPDIIADLFKKAGFTVKKQFVKNTTRKKLRLLVICLLKK
ncbi:hypothetical protein BuS5_04021 (plasmid) [Desulfosarcina sp. BuS5]|nr:hypothetical protein BuS5_04021 [Desulfosarcina sp. BuS5]